MSYFHRFIGFALTIAIIGVALIIAAFSDTSPASDSKPRHLIGTAVKLTTRPTSSIIKSDSQKLLAVAKKLAQPLPGDWLYKHREPGQNFDEYLRANPVCPTDKAQTIAILPLGEFTAKQEELVKLTAIFFNLYFGLPVEVLHKESFNPPASSIRNNPSTQQPQFLTGYILNTVLPAKRKPEHVSIIAITATDLWPGMGWNYVFGQASLQSRVGVWSIARYGDPHADDESFRKVLHRTLRTATHETAHMFTLTHCTKWECNLNGSNSLEESDRHPLTLCPDCQAKIWWAMNITDRKAYLSRLADFLEKQQLPDDAKQYRDQINTFK